MIRLPTAALESLRHDPSGDVEVRVRHRTGGRWAAGALAAVASTGPAGPVPLPVVRHSGTPAKATHLGVARADPDGPRGVILSQDDRGFVDRAVGRPPRDG